METYLPDMRVHGARVNGFDLTPCDTVPDPEFGSRCPHVCLLADVAGVTDGRSDQLGKVKLGVDRACNRDNKELTKGIQIGST
jgi:hypothetical protein